MYSINSSPTFTCIALILALLLQLTFEVTADKALWLEVLDDFLYEIEDYHNIDDDFLKKLQNIGFLKMV